MLGRSSFGGPGLIKAGDGFVAGIKRWAGEGEGWTGRASVSTRGLEIEGGDFGAAGLVGEVHLADTGVFGVAHGGDVAAGGDVEDLIGAEDGGEVAAADCLRNTGFSLVTVLLDLLEGGELLGTRLLPLGSDVIPAFDVGTTFGSEPPSPEAGLSVWLLVGIGDTFLGESLTRPCNATGAGLDNCCNNGFAPVLVLD